MTVWMYVLMYSCKYMHVITAYLGCTMPFDTGLYLADQSPIAVALGASLGGPEIYPNLTSLAHEETL